MSLLHINDRRGAYPDSWYAATANALDPFPPLRGETSADVAVIGAGYTGLSAALHLAEAGRDVVLIDAHRVGFGASGRNGGQLCTGLRQSQQTLERRFGEDRARALWSLAEDGKARLKSLIERHAIDCDLRPGVANTGENGSDVAALQAEAAHLADRYGYSEIEILDRDAFHAICPSPRYKGGILDHGAAHLHPLNLSLGLARAAQAAGVRIFETTEAHHIERRKPVTVATDRGRIKAEHAILACNGYLASLDRKVSARVMPINSFIAATERLGTRAAEVLTRDVAVGDSRFVVNYFRLSSDGRLLFGGGESYGDKFPADIAGKVRRPMLEIFPSLRDVRIDHAWGGTLGITLSRLPYLVRLAPNILSASGYSGQGVAWAVQAGYLMARAVEGETDGFDTISALPNAAFPGGSAMRSPLLTLAMTWYGLRDRLGF